MTSLSDTEVSDKLTRIRIGVLDRIKTKIAKMKNAGYAQLPEKKPVLESYLDLESDLDWLIEQVKLERMARITDQEKNKAINKELADQLVQLKKDGLLTFEGKEAKKQLNSIYKTLTA